MSDDSYAPEDMGYDEPPHAPTALALQPSRLPMSKAIAEEFGIDAPTWRVLVDQTFPAARTIEAVLMALSYCRARNLDIFKKPVHIVPMWSSAKKQMVETVWPGIAEIRTTAARTGEYAGIDAVEFGPMVERTFKGKLEVWENKRKGWKDVEKVVRYPEWARVTVYRIVRGQRFAFHAQVFWEETYAKMGRTEIPNEMWEKRARGQLDKCVEAAALRKAFPEEVGNMYAAEEMEGRTIDVTPAPATVEPPTPPEPPMPPTATEASGGTAPTKTASEAAEDFNNDESGVEAIPDFLARIEKELSFAMTPDAVEEAFDLLDVQATLTGDEEKLVEAFNIKASHVKRTQRAAAVAAGQTDMLDGMPEATRAAVKNARTL